MRIIKVPFPDVAFYEKTRLASQDPDQLTLQKGSTLLFLRNPTGYNANDYIVIEAFESDSAEIIQIMDVDPSSHMFDLSTPTLEDHSIGVVVVKTPYNKVKIYRGTSTDLTTHTEITDSPFRLRADNAYTYVYDMTGTNADYYSYKFIRTLTMEDNTELAADVQTLFTESDYDSVLTVKNLKDWFMFGLDLTDDDGYPFPNSMFAFAIRAAIDSLEKTLMVKIKPTQIVSEWHDYYRQEYQDFAFIQLNNWPIIFDNTKNWPEQGGMQVTLRYPTAQSDITFPKEWYQVRAERGHVHLVPTSGSLSQIMIGKGGDYLTFVFRGYDWMPNLWHIDYWAGFPQGQCPNDIIGIIGKMACFYPLNIAGDLVGGIAIASKSIGVDGLSQSINTTSSPENAGYSARLRQYERELKIEIPRLIAYYKSFRMSVC